MICLAPNAADLRRTQVIRLRGGVTLVDLVITVLIVGILAAVAAPRFAAAAAAMRTEAVARRIAADLNYARRTAILTSRETSVNFALSPAGYVMTGVTNPDRPAEAYQVSLSDLDAGASLASASFNGSALVSYNSYGRPIVSGAALTAGSVDVSVLGGSRTVVVDPNSGEATAP